jgi:hypothetical protein
MRDLSENWPENVPVRHRILCECVRCRRVRLSNRYVERLADLSLSTALRHAQDWAELDWSEAGRKSTMVLSPIEREIRWSAPASVSDILAKRAPDFEVPGRLRAYRITRDGKELYFGIVFGAGQSVGERIREHAANTAFTPAQRARSESKQLAKLLQEKRRTTMVRFSDISIPAPFRKDPKYLHAIELLLQSSLRPLVYLPSSISFEDNDNAE